MKKEYWEEYYQLHQDEIENDYLAVDKEYMNLESELRLCKKEIEKMIKENNPELWKKYDELSTAYNNLEAYLIKMMYIKGMEARDSMKEEK